MGILLKGGVLKLKQKFVGVSSTGVLGKAPAAAQALLFFGKSMINLTPLGLYNSKLRLEACILGDKRGACAFALVS